MPARFEPMSSPVNRLAAFGRLVLAFALALSVCVATPLSANAEVRRADLVIGESVEARGLSVSQCPSIDAQYAMVVDQYGTVYFQRDASTASQIASITKVMTALVALDAVENGTLSLDSEITVSQSAAAVGESSAGLRSGDVMTLETALYALLVPSGNDAAVAIAQWAGAIFSGAASDDEALQAFVDAMNAKAAELGCEDTVYRNPHGLDDGEFEGDQHSTASDQIKVVQDAMQNELFRTVVSSGDTTIQVTRDGQTTDIALTATDMFPQYCEYACGIKTGYTNKAGHSFAAAANNGDRYLYAVVLGSTSDSQRFRDAQTLCEWVYDNLTDYKLVNSQETQSTASGDVPIVAHVAHADWIDRTIPATLSDPSASVEVFGLNGNISQVYEFDEVHGNVSAGQKIGTVTFKQRNQVVATYDVVAAADVAAPNFFESVGIWWDRAFRGMSGDVQVAESQVVNSMPLINDKASLTS